MMRIPNITQHAKYGGKPCPKFVLDKTPQTEKCNTDDCPGNVYLYILDGVIFFHQEIIVVM